MGISTPKKPFNLAEFLNEKGKPRPMQKNFRYRSAAPAEEVGEQAPGSDDSAAQD